jgi:hypothetical protein
MQKKQRRGKLINKADVVEHPQNGAENCGLIRLRYVRVA